MTPVVRNRRQALKVRLVLWATVPVALAAAWGGWSIFATYGLSPADGGVLRPVWERALFGGGVAALGLVCLAGMALYASLYVLRLDAGDDQVELDTMTFAGRRTRRFAAGDFGGAGYQGGRFRPPRGASVNAPWITLKVRGRRLPLIIDLQSDEIDAARLAALAGRAVGDWQDDPGAP